MAIVDNCILHFELDSDSTDSTDNSYDGSDTDISYISGGIISNCATLDGDSSKINITTSVIAGSSGSFSCWFKTDAGGYIFSAGYSASNDYYLAFRIHIDGKFRFFQKSNDTETRYESSSTYWDDNWHHLVITSDGSNYLFYIDGSAMDGGFTGTDNGDWFSDTANLDQVYIGVLARTSDESFFDGEIDEFAMFDDTLTSGEVTTLYNSGAGLAYPFTVAGGNDLKINISDSWKTVAGVQINIGDSWKAVAGMQINIGDSWKEIF